MTTLIPRKAPSMTRQSARQRATTIGSMASTLYPLGRLFQGLVDRRDQRLDLRLRGRGQVIGRSHAIDLLADAAGHRAAVERHADTVEEGLDALHQLGAGGQRDRGRSRAGERLLVDLEDVPEVAGLGGAMLG